MRLYFVLAALLGSSECLPKQHPLILPPKGISQPPLGFGTWNLKESPENTTHAVALAIQKGYRQIDCAAAYGNEVAVGKGIQLGLEKAGLRREDIWVTSKLWNDHHAPSLVEPALEQTLHDLNLTYLDLYLMHWPVGKGPHDEKYTFDFVSTWRAMSVLATRPNPRVRFIGISNFAPAQLDALLAVREVVKPKVHQFETHPYLPQEEWLERHREVGIRVTAYSPLGNMNPTYGARDTSAFTSSFSSFSSSLPSFEYNHADLPLLLHHPVVKDVAKETGCSPAQVVLKWGMQRGASVIPKSMHEAYIEENFRAQECVLLEDNVKRVDRVGRRDGPRRFNNPSKGWGVKLFEELDDA